MKTHNIFTLLMIFVTIIFCYSIYMHENAHVQAYRQKGYYNNTVSLRFPDVVTTNHDEIRPEDKSDIYNTNMMIEAVGYNIQAWGLGLMLMLVFIVVELIGIRRGEK